MKLNGWGSGEDFGELGGRVTIFRIYCIKILSFFNNLLIFVLFTLVFCLHVLSV